MKTKIFYGNQYVESFKCDGRKYSKFEIWVYKIKQSIKRVILALGAVSLIGWSVLAGRHFFPRVAIVEAEVIKEVTAHAPVMDKIAKCESGNSHINPKTGQVYMVANANKTVDVGKFMINTVWHKKAKELGLDITKEKDNEEMAYWIYANRGTGDWKYSAECWQK